MSVINIVRQNIMQYADLIGEDLAEHICMSIAEDLDELDESEE